MNKLVLFGTVMGIALFTFMFKEWFLFYFISAFFLYPIYSFVSKRTDIPSNVFRGVCIGYLVSFFFGIILHFMK